MCPPRGPPLSRRKALMAMSLKSILFLLLLLCGLVLRDLVSCSVQGTGGGMGDSDVLERPNTVGGGGGNPPLDPPSDPPSRPLPPFLIQPGGCWIPPPPRASHAPPVKGAMGPTTDFRWMYQWMIGRIAVYRASVLSAAFVGSGAHRHPHQVDPWGPALPTPSVSSDSRGGAVCGRGHLSGPRHRPLARRVPDRHAAGPQHQRELAGAAAPPSSHARGHGRYSGSEGKCRRWCWGAPVVQLG